MNPDTVEEQTIEAEESTRSPKMATLFAALTLPFLASCGGEKENVDPRVEADSLIRELNQPAVERVVSQDEIRTVSKPEYQELSTALDSAYEATELARKLSDAHYWGDRKLYSRGYENLRYELVQIFKKTQELAIEASYDDKFSEVQDHLADLSQELGTVASLIQYGDLHGDGHRMAGSHDKLFDLQGTIKLVQFGLTH